jgi:ricin-type beta-trefoil lectin protein
VIRNDGLGKCLNDRQGATANGTTVDSSACTNGAAQSWSFNPRSDYYSDLGFWGWVTPTGAASKCLSVTSANGGKVQSVALAGSTQMIWTESGQVWAKSGIGLGGWVNESDYDPQGIAGGSDGTQLMIGADASLYARNTTGSDPWTKEAWNVRRISTNGGVQMYADEDGAVFARTGIGTPWTKESGAATDPGFTAAIAAGPDGTQMYIDSGYFVYAKKGVALNGWTKEGTGLVDAFDFATSIAAGTGGIQMMITNDGGMADARASTGTTAWTLETDATTESDNGRPLQLVDCHDWRSQRWLFQHNKTGSAQLVNEDTGKCVDTPNSSTTDGTALWLYTCNGTIAQRFAPPTTPAVAAGPITNPQTGKCAVAASTTAAVAAATNVVLYGCGIGYTTGPHLAQKQLLEQSLKALPGILFGEFIGCYKKITGASGGSLVDCGIVVAELALPTAMKFLVNGVRDLRLAMAAGDVAGIDSALAVLKQSAIDTKALIKA